MTGNEIRAIRKAFGLPIDQFARVIGVHPVTLNRWELKGEERPGMEGMAGTILLGLRQRLANSPKQQIKREAASTGIEITELIAIGGILLAVGALIAFANAGKGK